MSAPPLASIQANALLCQLLILTQNSQAYYFATMHRTRTISVCTCVLWISLGHLQKEKLTCEQMAERAGLFNAEKAVSHWDLDWGSFDWHIWSESEMRRR